MHTEFVFHNTPFASCHAATIVAAEQGLIAAWFGGEESHRDSKGWSPVTQVASGLLSNGGKCACWNPVLFAAKPCPAASQNMYSSFSAVDGFQVITNSVEAVDAYDFTVIKTHVERKVFSWSFEELMKARGVKPAKWR